MTIQQSFEAALQHHQSGRLVEAEAIYTQILAVEPRHADALHLLGVVAHHAGRNDVAAELIRRAIALAPAVPEYHSNLGNALAGKGQFAEAIAAFRQAIALRPNYPEARNNLGNALRDIGQLTEAIAACREAIALRPGYPEAHYNLGNALRDKGELDEAIAAFRRAVAFRPNFPEAHCNLGNALLKTGELNGAIAAYRQALALRPNLYEVHSNLGVALEDVGHFDESIASYRHAIALQPDYPEAHKNLALALLLQGNFSEGWKDYEWRWKMKDFPSPRRNFTQAQWDGGCLDGLTLLLHAEQGFGDAVQFIRYLPLVRRRGGQAVIECQPELLRLFQIMAPNLQIVAKGQNLPPFDVHCPLLSLPRLFATDLTNIPQSVPYLHPDAADAGRWRDRLSLHSSSFKVGLAWAGSRTHKNDRNRSLKLASLAPLAEIPGVQFFSLQKGESAPEALSPPKGMKCFDFTEELKDFADTTALIAALDLVISVDTAVVHLAGAMGKPVWTLLPFAPDWRWMLAREDSPWYPTMRLFRQTTMGDWSTVIANVREQLQLLVQSWRGKP